MFVNKLRTSKTVSSIMLCLFLLCVVVIPFTASALSLMQENNHQTQNSQDTPSAKTVEPILYTNKNLIESPVNITVMNHGQEENYSFFKSNVSTFMNFAGIKLSDYDMLSVGMDTVISKDMTISIDSVEFVTETRRETEPYEIIETPVQTIPKGTREVVQKGQNGECINTYIVKLVNGEKAEEVLYSRQIVSYPVEETVNVGVGGSFVGKDGKTYNFSYYKMMEATAYTYVPGLTTMTTATGRRLDYGIIAVDPRVIPLHTKLYVTGSFEYGYGEAEDTGGVIKGDIIDLAFMSYDECIQFGRRQVKVYILED